MQKYSIAGLIVEMDVKYERLRNHAKAYIYNGKKSPDFTLVLKEKAFSYARENFSGLSDSDIEYLLYSILFYDKLLDFDGMMLHASAVAYENRAYLFSADSGVGKSTHTSYWTELFDSAVIINDDKPALRFVDGELYVYGTPFSGKHNISVNSRVLLGGICFLERGEANHIETIEPKEALRYILKQSVSNTTEERISKKLEIMDKVLNSAKLYKMKCTNDISAAKVSYEKMKTAMPVRLLQLLPVLEEALNFGAAVTFTTHGKSMRPILNDGDSVTIKKYDKYKVGDVILFRNTDGDFVLHRIIKIKNGLIYAQGDQLCKKDEPIKFEQVLGKAITFIYKNKEVKITELSYKVYKVIYMSYIGRKIRLIKRKVFSLFKVK